MEYFDYCDMYLKGEVNIPTKKLYIRLHRLLWLKIAKEILEKKHSINIEIFKYKMTPNILNSCWLCEYTTEIIYSRCNRCPLYPGKYNIQCLNGLYSKVCRAINYKEQFILAIRIATLPEVR